MVLEQEFITKRAASITMRPMGIADLDQIMDIEPIAFGSHHWSRQSFLNELTNPGGNYFIAYDPSTGSLLGYTGFWLIGEEAHVTILAVHPQFRRQYIGEKLLLKNIFEAHKVGANWLTLEVRVSNQAAQDLYSKYDFKNLGLRRNYYQDNDEDALVLWTENINTVQFISLVRSRIGILYNSGACSKLEFELLSSDKFFDRLSQTENNEMVIDAMTRPNVMTFQGFD